MIGAFELMGVAVALGHRDAAVRAAVGEGLQLARLVAGDDDGLVQDAESPEITRFGKFFLARDGQPVAHEDQLFFQFIDFL